MKIIHLTDLHLPAPGSDLWGLDPFARAASALDDIARHHADADLCVISGDLANHGDPGAYAWLGGKIAAFPLETVLMIGNHDDRAVAAKTLPSLARDGAGFIQCARDLGPFRLLFLDTVQGETSAGAYCQRRQDWLAAELSAAEGRPVVIFMHHPPFDVGIPYMDRIKLEDHAAFGSLLGGHDIRHLFFGHIHRPCFVTWQGIPCSALPATAHQVPLDRPAMGTSYSIEPPMYGVITLTEEQTIVHLDAWADRRPADMDW
ncbi:MAG: phosphodiesterase [Pseudomonadota bacterium]